MNTEQTLQKRGEKYGEFHYIANFTEHTLSYLMQLRQGRKTDPTYIEAAHMIIQKLARAFNGDIDYDDSWLDISGYAMLANEYAKKKAQK